MARSKRPYPGLGDYVVISLYGDTWVAYRGAKTEEKARAYARELSHYPHGTVKVVPNFEPVLAVPPLAMAGITVEDYKRGAAA